MRRTARLLCLLLAGAVLALVHAAAVGQVPLTGLPSKPGPHVERIKALADNTWLELGAPAPDPKWGRARGRSWFAAMPFAPVLRRPACLSSAAAFRGRKTVRPQFLEDVP